MRPPVEGCCSAEEVHVELALEHAAGEFLHQGERGERDWRAVALDVLASGDASLGGTANCGTSLLLTLSVVWKAFSRMRSVQAGFDVGLLADRRAWRARTASATSSAGGRTGGRALTRSGALGNVWHARQNTARPRCPPHPGAGRAVAGVARWIGQPAEVSGRVTMLDKEDQPGDDVGQAVLWLSGPPSQPRLPVQAEIGTSKKEFSPHVLVVPVGSTVSFPNHDPFNHNVFSLSEENPFDLGLYGRDEVRSVRFDGPGWCASTATSTRR